MKPYQDIKKINKEITQYGNSIKSILRKHAKIRLSRMSVLDIGCGNGFFEFALSPYVKTIYGIDPSLHMLKDARLNNQSYKFKNIRFYKGSAENIPFIKKFDLILFSYSLHFTKDPKAVLNKVLSNLKKNGLLLILEPTKTFTKNGKFDRGCKNFNKRMYDGKQKALVQTRSIIDDFSDEHEILYMKHDNKVYWVLLRINN